MEPWTFYLSPFPPSSAWEPQPPLHALLHFPLLYIGRLLYLASLALRPQPLRETKDSVRVVTLSDTHDNVWPDVPDGDLLIHAGDLTNKGTMCDLQAQIDWLNSLPHRHKIAIAGNHDTYLDPRTRDTLAREDRSPELEWGGVRYLQHQSLELAFPDKGGRRLKVYAAPQIPTEREAPSDWAFSYPAARDAWTDTVPADTDILITHGPPRDHLDVYGLGCRWLLAECWRVRPRLHVFGHVHAGRGSEAVWWDECQAAYERLCARARPAGLASILDRRNWVDLALVALHGLESVAWVRLWGGHVAGTLQVNTALMYRSTGRLGNEPQVVYV